jgi:hypothetical protein
MSLVFLSDGTPSDAALSRGTTKEECHAKIVEQVRCLASQFGRRLTFIAVGIGDLDSFMCCREWLPQLKIMVLFHSSTCHQ